MASGRGKLEKMPLRFFMHTVDSVQKSQRPTHGLDVSNSLQMIGFQLPSSTGARRISAISSTMIPSSCRGDPPSEPRTGPPGRGRWNHGTHLNHLGCLAGWNPGFFTVEKHASLNHIMMETMLNKLILHQISK